MSAISESTKSESKEELGGLSIGVIVAKDESDDLESAKIVRKLDFTVLPIVTMLYLLSYLDRTNIGNARVAGLQKALKLTDHQYQICISILFVPYILSEIPANLVLRKIGARRILPTLVVIWSVAVTLQGLVSSYHGLLAVRFFLGLVEGPLLPGLLLYLSGFYTRRELSLRVALVFSTAALSGAFSGLLAAAIQQMNGVAGLDGWAWIFILEGLFSFCMGVIGFLLLPSSPQESKFLTQDEKSIAIDRLIRDRPSLIPSDTFSIWEVIKTFKSPHVVLVFLIYFMAGVTFYGLAFFLPSIVGQLGFDANKTQLLSVGPFATAFLITLPIAFLSDRYNTRVVPIVALGTLAIAGFAMYLRAESKFVSYGSLFLSAPGIYGSAPIIMAWMANNSEPYFRRATSTALLFVAANCGGILSTWSYPTSEGPRFVKATIMNLVFCVAFVILALVNAALLNWMNAKKKKNREKILAPYIDDKDGVRAWMELGDEHPDFVYTL